MWAVLGEKNSRDTSLMKNQLDAFYHAREIAINQGGDVILHGRDGKIRERNTYGKIDYCPPSG